MTKSKVSFSHWGARPHGKTIGYAVKMKGQKKHTKFITVLDGSFEKEMKHNLIWYSNLSILEVKFFLFWESPKAPKTKRSSAQTWESWRNRLHMTSSPQQKIDVQKYVWFVRFVSSGRLGSLQVWMLSNFLWQRWSSALGHQCWLVPGGCQHPMLWDLMLFKSAM